MSSIRRRNRGELVENNNNNNNKIAEPFHMYKNKSSHWWRVLNVGGQRRVVDEVPVSAKVLDQVKLDVGRAFCFPSGLYKGNIFERREMLFTVITAVLARNPSFKYYQGFHEICSLFLIVFEGSGEKCILAIEKFTMDNLTESFGESFDKILRQYTEMTLFIASNYAVEYGTVRLCSNSEKKKFDHMLSGIKELVEPHGLMASWFLTWFVHEFPDFGDSLNIFDFQLTELGRAKELSPVYIASSLMIIYREKMVDWKEEPFELIMFLRNLPKIASSNEVIKYSRLIYAAVPLKRRIQFGNQFWISVLLLNFIYHFLSMTFFPKLKYI